MQGVPVTKSQRAIYLAALERGHSHVRAAREAGVSVRVMHLWRQRDEAFALAVMDAVEAGTDYTEDTLRAIAVGEDDGPVSALSARVQACLAILRARRPERWSERYRIEHSGRVEHTVSREQIRRAAEADPEALERAAAALMGAMGTEADG